MIHPLHHLHFMVARVAPGDFTPDLVWVFIIVVVALGIFRQIQQQKMWHETVRLAIEKGKPVPRVVAQNGPFGAWYLYRGALLIATGIGMFLVPDNQIHKWAPLPICIGAASLLFGLFNYLRAKNDGDSQDPANRQ